MADSRPNTHGLNEVPDIQQHHMTKSFSLIAEIVAVFLAIVNQNASGPKLLEVAQRIAIGDVILVYDGTFQIGNEEDVEVVGPRNLSKIAVCLVFVQIGKMQMGIAAIPALSGDLAE